MTRSKVAVLRVSPATVVDDVYRLCELAGLREALDPTTTTILKDNISWHYPFPAANTTPWQLEGTIRALRDSGYRDVTCVQNKTVVTDAFKGEDLNHYKPIFRQYDVPVLFNFKESDMRWVQHRPRAKMRVLDRIFPDGIHIPDYFFGKNVVHLPTMKCHIYTTTTGAMKNAFGGLLSTHRHYTHSWIHETLVDLLAIQKEIHSGLFAIMDGTTAGNGPGPRTMLPVVKNYMLASADQVAIDAVSAKMMGFDPMALDYIRLADEDGLGNGRPENIELVGDDVRGENWHFEVGKNLVRFGGGDLIWFGPFKRFQKLLFHTPLVHLFIGMSEAYHDYYRWPLRDKRVFDEWRRGTEWGRLFDRYASGPPSPPHVTLSAPAPARPSVKLGRALALAAAAGALFYVAFAFYTGLPKVLDSLRSYAWWTAGAAAGLAAINYVLRYAKWELYLRRLGVRIPVSDSFLIFLSGFSLTVTPGKVGEVLKSYLLREAHQVPMARTAPIVVAERLTDLVALALLALVGVGALAGGERIVWVALALVAIALVCVASEKLAHGMIDLVGALPGVGKMAPKLREFYGATQALVAPGPLVLATLLSVAAWVCECVSFYVVLRGFPGVVVTLKLCTFIYATMTVAGALSFLPGGLGVQEVGMVRLLVAQAHGVTGATAMAATFVTRVCTLWFAVLVGVVALALVQRRARVDLSTMATMATKTTMPTTTTPPTTVALPAREPTTRDGV